MAWPTTRTPRDVTVMFRLTADEARDLDLLVQSKGHKTKSDCLRQILASAVATARKQGALKQ